MRAVTPRRRLRPVAQESAIDETSERDSPSGGNCGRSNAVGITAKQFEELRRRTSPDGKGAERDGKRRELPGEGVPVVRVVLGVDPSLRGTGWGVVRLEGRQPDWGCPWDHSLPVIVGKNKMSPEDP